MNVAQTTQKTRAIVVEEMVPHSAEKVWHALTSSELISRWLMTNDFRPERGHKFTFRATPMGDWDGVVYCEVLEIDPPKLLKYSWFGGSVTTPGRYTLESTVTWMLTPVEGGTRVKMVHNGFVSPQNDFGYNAMSQGWGTVFMRISKVIAEAA